MVALPTVLLVYSFFPFVPQQVLRFAIDVVLRLYLMTSVAFGAPLKIVVLAATAHPSTVGKLELAVGLMVLGRGPTICLAFFLLLLRVHHRIVNWCGFALFHLVWILLIRVQNLLHPLGDEGLELIMVKT